MCGWEWIPHKKGFVSGMIVGGFGFGTFIFAYISSAIVNPDNERPVLMPNGDRLYEWEIASRVNPNFLNKSSIGTINVQMVKFHVVFPSFNRCSPN
jgi:hypothetical protein